MCHDPARIACNAKRLSARSRDEILPAIAELGFAELSEDSIARPITVTQMVLIFDLILDVDPILVLSAIWIFDASLILNTTLQRFHRLRL